MGSWSFLFDLQHAILRSRSQPRQAMDPSDNEQDATDPQAIHRSPDDQTAADAPIGGRGRPEGGQRVGQAGRIGQLLHRLYVRSRLPSGPIRPYQSE